MKKYNSIFLLLFVVNSIMAQESNVFLRHDTILLKAGDANWLVPGFGKDNTARDSIGKWYLDAVRLGKFEAFDPVTSERIPADKIYTWRMPADTVALSGETSTYKIIQSTVKLSDITRIRVQQDWYFNNNTGEFISVTKWIELLIEIHGPGGFRGYRPFCRLNFK
jgi:hypothetical protein